MIQTMLLPVFAADVGAKVVEDGLAPFVALGTVTATMTAVGAWAAWMAARREGWDRATTDAYLQSVINRALAMSAFVWTWPVGYLIAAGLS